MKKHQAFFLVSIILTLIFSALGTNSNAFAQVPSTNTITGNVFRDLNANGVDDGVNEIGVAGIIVTAYDAAGTEQGTTTTDTNGNYTLSAGGTGPWPPR